MRLVSYLFVGALLNCSQAFSVRPVGRAFLSGAPSSSRVFSVESDGEADDESVAPSEPDKEETPLKSAPMPVPSRGQVRRLDPLIASLTRVEPSMANTPTANVPLLGEIPVDGGLVVLIPAAVIALVGFVMSFVVAYNARDTFVEDLAQVSNDINSAALAKTNQAVPVDSNVCYGICSSQEEQLESMKVFLDRFAKK